MIRESFNYKQPVVYARNVICRRKRLVVGGSCEPLVEIDVKMSEPPWREVFYLRRSAGDRRPPAKISSAALLARLLPVVFLLGLLLLLTIMHYDDDATPRTMAGTIARVVKSLIAYNYLVKLESP